LIQRERQNAFHAVFYKKETDMFYNAKSRQVKIDGDTMNYIEFGAGTKALVILPGLGDGLDPVHGQAQAALFAVSYRRFARRFKVYLFSRKNHLEENCTTRSMAAQQAAAMQALGIQKAAVLGVSQGGMIAQYLATDFPALVERLVLAVTLARPNGTVRGVVPRWIALAEAGDHKRLMIDTAEHSYSERYLKTYRFLYPLFGSFGKPKSYDRFLRQAASCLTHDAYAELPKIACPTLVIGGGCDKIVGTGAAPELAEKIPDSELFLYQNYGHAAYEEAKDFNDKVFAFFSENTPA